MVTINLKVRMCRDTYDHDSNIIMHLLLTLVFLVILMLTLLSYNTIHVHVLYVHMLLMFRRLEPLWPNGHVSAIHTFIVMKCLNLIGCQGPKGHEGNER